MARKKYTAEQIITKLREAEIELAKGLSLDNSILKEVSSGNF